MQIILVRHGIAVEASEWRGSDADRPLTDEGEDKTRQAAYGLRRLKIEPDRIMASPLVRAQQTAVILQEVLECSAAVQTSRALCPEGDPEGVLAVLAGYGAEETIVCVGHEPNISSLAGTLLVGAPVPGLRFKKAGACCLRVERRVKPGEALLEWWLPPGQLRLLARR